jgi:hypothetical protein
MGLIRRERFWGRCEENRTEYENMFEKFLRKYKTKGQIDAGIEKIKILNSRDYEVIKKTYFEIFPDLPIVHVKMKTAQIQEILCVFRTRPSCPNLNVLLNKSFSYPNANDFSAIQRANWEGRNVFYGSDTFYTSLAETKIIYPEKEFYISAWGFDFSNTDIQEVLVVPLAFGQMSEDNPWRSILNIDLYIENELKKDLSVKEAKLVYHFLYKIGELFTIGSDDAYPITAFLADQILYHQRSIEAGFLPFPILIYPSVSNNFNSCNFAISPYFVDRFMCLEKVFKIKLTNVTGEKLSYKISQIGIPNSKKSIVWHNFFVSNNEGFYQINAVFCSCGYILSAEEVVSSDYIMEGQNFKHNELITMLMSRKDLTHFFSDENLIEEKNVVLGFQSNLEIRTSNVMVQIGETNHTNLTFDISYISPFVFEKI